MNRRPPTDIHPKVRTGTLVGLGVALVVAVLTQVGPTIPGALGALLSAAGAALGGWWQEGDCAPPVDGLAWLAQQEPPG